MSGDFLVEVEVRYVDRESEPDNNRYVFAYTITISNRGATAAQLLSRYWRITDGDGGVREVSGPGVVGRQPLIQPGHAFRYTSAAVLETPVGCMEGHYEFARDAEAPAEPGGRFQVPIPAFSLSLPNAVH